MMKLNEDIGELNLQLSEEKARNSKLNNDYLRYKNEKQRLEEFCEDLREKDNRNSDAIASSKTRIQQSIEDVEKVKSENRMLELSY